MTIKIRLVPSRYLSVFWAERRLRIRLRRARGLMGREEGKIATGRFRSLETCRSFFPSHETPRAPQPNSQSSLIPKNTWIATGYESASKSRKSRRETFCNETAFLFWFHVLWKLGSSNCCVFEKKRTSGLESCTKSYFLFIFNLV